MAPATSLTPTPSEPRLVVKFAQDRRKYYIWERGSIDRYSSICNISIYKIGSRFNFNIAQPPVFYPDYRPLGVNLLGWMERDSSMQKVVSAGIFWVWWGVCGCGEFSHPIWPV